MTANPAATPRREHPLWSVAILAVATAIALVSARPHAGSWNDGSRLATVEALVDHHTLVIDRSIFVEVPQSTCPYDPADPGLCAKGTADKLLIDGHFYSDKSPVPALLLAGLYQCVQWCTGLKASQAPRPFVYWLTVGSSGLAYTVAVWSVFCLGIRLGLAPKRCLFLAASLALGTVALAYVRQVNNHIFLLGVAAALVLQLNGLAQDCQRNELRIGRLLAVGSLTGLGYSIDLGAGPVLLISVLGLVAWRCRGMLPLGWVVLAVAPWLILHHAMNYRIGGTFKPANAVAAYFSWPGCPFTESSLTGGWHGRSVVRTSVYTVEMLVGKCGFLGHNLPLLPALVGFGMVYRKRPETRPELLFAACWCLGTWLAYGLTSTNYSGRCCSIRWFVPLLAPGYLVMAHLLREQTSSVWPLLILSGWGTALGLAMWAVGPWDRVPGLVYWPLVVCGLASCFCWQLRRSRGTSEPGPRAAIGVRSSPRAA